MAAKRGVAHHKAKLNPDLVRNIWELRGQGLSYVKITEAIGNMVNVTTVRGVIEGRIWSHVGREGEDKE